MNKISKVVEDALHHAKYVRDSIDELAESRDNSMLKALGLPSDTVDSDSSDDQSTDDERDIHVDST